jgi:DNA (cytosine-5)-methyltransferase 1
MAFYPTNRNPDEGIYEEIATTVKHDPGAVLAFSSKDSGADATLDLAPTMRAMNYDQSWLNGGGQLAVAFDWQASVGHDTSWRGKGRQHIVRAGDYAGACSATRVDAVMTPNDDELPVKISPTAVVRRLMPIECARLQGFPDDWIPSTIADSHHYRMLGNAVCVPVVEWLLRRVRTALEGV